MGTRTRLITTRVDAALKKAIVASDVHLIEIQNATCAIIVGLIFLLNNGRLYDRSPRAWQMFEVLPEFFWGFLFVGSGVVHLSCLKWSNDRLRKFTLLVKAGLWVFLGTALLAGVGWWAPAVWIYYIFAIVAFRGYFKIQVGVND